MLYSVNYILKRIFLLVLISSIIAGCASPKKHFQKGHYNMAFYGALKKLKKNPKNDKMIRILERSYILSNQNDQEKINFLNLEGNPDRWNEVYAYYLNLKQRQSAIRPVLPLKSSAGKRVDFPIINYDEEIIKAKNNAANFHYTRGSQFLEKGTRSEARLAYSDFMAVKKFFDFYKDTDQKINQSLQIGTSYVIFKMKNDNRITLPPAFEKELLAISLHDLNRQWLAYHTQEWKDFQYDYSINVNIQNIMVSPEGLKEVHFTETKEVEDGFQYKLDSRGNVMKDSLGNDIKIPKMKIITCNLIETRQNKSAVIIGRIDFIDNYTNQLLLSEPISADFYFEHNSLIAVGDINALKVETKKRLGNKPMPFPPDPDMILQAGFVLKNMTKNILNHKRLLFN
jgi:hypothetical protein